MAPLNEWLYGLTTVWQASVPDGVSDDALLLGPRPPPAEVPSVGGQLDAHPHRAATAPDHLYPAGLEGGQTGGRGRGGHAVRQAGAAGGEAVRPGGVGVVLV